MKTSRLKIYRNRQLLNEIQITDKQICIAIEQYNQEYPLNYYPRTNESPNIKTWFENQSYTYAIKYNGKCYPPKYILRLVVESQLEDEDDYFYGGGKPGNANIVLEELGFQIISQSECQS